MNTVTVFVADQRERRRKQRSAALMIVVAGSVLILARKPIEAPRVAKPQPLALPAPAPSTLARELLTPFMPPAPPPVEYMPESITIKVPVQVTPRPVPPPAPTTQTAAPPPAPVPATPLPPPELLVEPRNLHFTSPGWTPVTVTNPNAFVIRIDDVVARGAQAGYRVEAKECIGIALQPKESCRVRVIASPAAIVRGEAIVIDVVARRAE